MQSSPPQSLGLIERNTDFYQISFFFLHSWGGGEVSSIRKPALVDKRDKLQAPGCQEEIFGWVGMLVGRRGFYGGNGSWGCWLVWRGSFFVWCLWFQWERERHPRNNASPCSVSITWRRLFLCSFMGILFLAFGWFLFSKHLPFSHLERTGPVQSLPAKDEFNGWLLVLAWARLTRLLEELWWSTRPT